MLGVAFSLDGKRLAACTVPGGSTFDVRPRALVLGAGSTLTVDVSDAVTTVRADSVRMLPGARLFVRGSAGRYGIGGTLSLIATPGVRWRGWSAPIHANSSRSWAIA